MAHFVYVIRSKKSGSYYIGSSDNLERRVQEHNSGKTLSTRGRGPYELVHFESFETLSLARGREYKIKSYKGGNAFKKLIG